MPMDIKKSVSIIIPNYNGRHLLEEYLPYTITAIQTADTAFEIIIVDDCSTDDSVAFIKAKYPELSLIVNPGNKGFSYTCNRGIEASQYELIFLLNSDVKLAPDYFEHQWKYFTRWDTFGVMGRIIDMDGDNIQDAARVPKFNGLKLKTDYFYYTDKILIKKHNTDIIQAIVGESTGFKNYTVFQISIKTNSLKDLSIFE